MNRFSGGSSTVTPWIAEYAPQPPTLQARASVVIRTTTLALALDTQGDLIISADDDLLSLNVLEDVSIVTPNEALRRIEAQSSRHSFS